MKIPSACEDLVPRTPEAFLDPVLMNAWDEFLARYPKKKDCLDEIVSVLLASGLLFCRKCKKQSWDKPKGRVLTCLDCTKERSATAGTFFDHMRSFRAWLAAIWFAQRGILISSTVFQKLLNIAHSSARLLLKRVMAAMKEPMQKDVNTLKVPSAVFIELFRRRSLETKAGQHPRTEEDAYAQEHEVAIEEICQPVEQPVESQSPNVSQQATETESHSDEQRAILEALAAKPLTSDQLASKTGLPMPEISASLSMLEMDGLCKRLPGNQFMISDRGQPNGAAKKSVEALSDAAVKAVKTICQSLEARFNGVSRKHLETYLIAHWCSVRKGRPQNNQNNHNKHKNDSRSVLDACLKFGRKTGQDLFSQITPPVVHIQGV